MIISVASGKGGTGKTTVSTNLAVSIEGAVEFMDCDVEAPNAHLFLKPDIRSKESVFTMIPAINEEMCNLCGKCIDICRFRAITRVAGTLLTFPEMCHSCGGCFAICPENAVEESGRELGTLEIGRVSRTGGEDIGFVHGRLKIGEAMSPPLIRTVRSYEEPGVVNIIDAPPGTSCPVIAAMKHVDFVLMVTEPTPFGLHDLELAVGAVDLLGIPKGLVINRSDLGDGRVKAYAEKNEIPVLMEIPFERRIAEAYSRGELISETIPEYRDGFKTLYSKIESVLNSL